MESSFLTPRYFYCFLYLVCKLFKGLFQSLCQSVNCMIWFDLIWIMEHTSEISRNVSINLYLRPCSIDIYAKFYLYCLYHLKLFWSVNYVLHFGSVKIHRRCLYWNVFSIDINGNIIFNCLLLFKPFFLVSKLCESGQ